MNEADEVIAREPKCPVCGEYVTYYTVKELGVGGTVARHVGCSAPRGECLLAGQSWSFHDWDEVCKLVADDDAACDQCSDNHMDLIHQLDGLVHTWSVYAELLAEVHPSSPANAAFRKCANELSWTLKHRNGGKE